MKHEMQTKRSMAVLSTGMVLLAWGLAPIASAKKPVKPPPEPPQEARYTLVDLGISSWHTSGINKWGQVVGNPEYPFSYAFLVAPSDVDGDGVPDTWFADDENGGNALIIDLGSLGGDGSEVLDINDHGQVVGGAKTGGPSTDNAFIIVPEDTNGDDVPDTWFAGDGNGENTNALMINLGTPSAGGDRSGACSISNTGYVVGGVGGSIPEVRGIFIVVPEDNTGGPDGGPDGFADTWFRDDGSGHNALMTLLMSSPTLRYPQATGVNDSGHVVGCYSETNSELDDQAFLIMPADVDRDGNPDTWFADADTDGINDLMIELEPSPGDTNCRAHAINSVSDSGVVQVVGESWFINSTVSSGYHGVRWEIDELGNVTLTDLGKVYPYGINDVGQVVGSHRWGSRKKRHYGALLWENGTMTSLVDMLSNSEGIGDITGSAINEYGDIVGYLDVDGSQHAYIAVANSPTP